MLPNNNNNNSISTINQQLNNLGTINKQLTTLSQQLCGLNQQSQNLQNFDACNNLTALQQLSLSPVPNLNNNNNSSPSSHNNNNINNNLKISINDSNNNHKNNNNNNSNKNINNNNESGNASDLNANAKQQQLQKKQLQLQPLPQPQQKSENFLPTDLFLSNQELLNRLQTFSLGLNNNNNNNNSIINRSYSPCNSFLYADSNQLINNNNNNNSNKNSIVDSMHQLTNNNNFKLLNSPSSVVNMTPSPTFNRSSYSSSPMLDNSSSSPIIMDMTIATIDECNDSTKFIRPILAAPLISSMHSVHDPTDLKFPLLASGGGQKRINKIGSSRSSSSIAGAGASGIDETIRQKSDKRVTLPDFTLHITDECGNIMNSRKQSSSATPSAITRTTSEKVSNRSQLMSEVQRTAWARHTTK